MQIVLRVDGFVGLVFFFFLMFVGESEHHVLFLCHPDPAAKSTS